jgi:HSP20 family molecular chaperone IbpA
VHVLPEEIDPAQADVKAVDGLLHVYMPKKNKLLHKSDLATHQQQVSAS